MRLVIFLPSVFADGSHSIPIPITGMGEVCFSPRDGEAETAAVAEISWARQEILIQAYRFTSKPIAKALL